MLRGGAYQPERLVLGMGDALIDPELKVGSVHLFSFNQIDETVAWQRRFADHQP